MNTAVHSAAGYTLAYLNFGRDLPTTALLEYPLPKDWADKVSKLKEIC
jgi:hypothetical protein